MSETDAPSRVEGVDLLIDVFDEERAERHFTVPLTGKLLSEREEVDRRIRVLDEWKAENRGDTNE